MGLDNIRAVDYTVLLCRDMTETRAFYRDVMRFPIEVERETWISFRVGATPSGAPATGTMAGV
jgi:catechol 2,3-dioxygenase-like lactoylglutathione lyase family enzyme